jgi:hypothetical protein
MNTGDESDEKVIKFVTLFQSIKSAIVPVREGQCLTSICVEPCLMTRSISQIAVRVVEVRFPMSYSPPDFKFWLEE